MVVQIELRESVKMQMTISATHASQLCPLVKGGGFKVGQSANISIPSGSTTMLVNLKCLTEDFFYLSDSPQDLDDGFRREEERLEQIEYNN